MATSDLEQLKALGQASANKAEDFAADVSAYVVAGAADFAMGSLGLPPMAADALSRRLHILIKEGIAKSSIHQIKTRSLIVVDETEGV